MARKGNWFSSVKKALSPESKEKTDQRSNKSKKKWFAKQKQPCSDSASSGTSTMPALPQQEEVKLANGENEQSEQAYSVAVASAAAAEAAVAAAEAAAEVVRLTAVTRFSGKSREEVAAIRIQTAFRGYMARRALRALRGLVRLKSLMEGPVVKRQAAKTLRCMQTLARVQSQIRSRRIRMSEENQALQKQLLQKRAKELESLQIGDEWDDSFQSKEQIEANLLGKYEAAMRRERALAYAFSHQKTWKNSSRSVNPMFMDPSNPTWGWSWLERWMAARPWESRSMMEKELNNDHSSVKSASHSVVGGEISKSFARYQLNSDNHSPSASQKTGNPSFQSPSTPRPTSSKVAKKVKPASPRGGCGPNDDSKSMVSLQSEQFRRHSIAGSSMRDDESLASSRAVPSYMVPTKSAKAKTRLQSPLGAAEKNGTPEKGTFGPAKKRLSFPPSPARPRRHSGPPKVDVSLNKENNTSTEVGS
ncbi:protein IQ-DOMAIN 1 [Juglans microcarpa x Juglans regia]|uniref:protein IQ-DOMAIN 1 n=1 Tax=Juglans microcarpa x Juglans regia TaxID=2249226 RepID=UPI001B7EBE38|nr:protein IQ-DOMAIN 1 [Juglans microcarpa x Juglans regia]